MRVNRRPWRTCGHLGRLLHGTPEAMIVVALQTPRGG
jgi:hypothetical protein